MKKDNPLEAEALQFAASLYKEVDSLVLRLAWMVEIGELERSAFLRTVNSKVSEISTVPSVSTVDTSEYQPILQIFARALAEAIQGRARKFSFGEFLQQSAILLKDLAAHESVGDHGLIESIERFSQRISRLSPALISGVKEVHAEFLAWLRCNPGELDRIHWEAFEKIIAEILQSHGFEVDLTGRMRNRSADILAIRTDEFGQDTRYLIECKRYSKERRIGIDIVNSVLGAKVRANVDHAMLVTTSEFTRDVKRLENEFRDHRLHIHDGAAVVEWLQDYKPREDGGLWLPTGWNLDEE